MSAVAVFYAQRYWGSRYGVVDAFHRTPHKGLDLALFKGVVDVPALHAGQVVATAASLSVGHYVTVKRADGLFDTYCHIVPAVKVGQTVRQGDRLGRQAITKAEGGIDWAGQHTHLCLSRTQSGWAVWGYVNIDPTPGVIAALTSTASDGSTSLPNEPDQALLRRQKGDTMYTHFNADPAIAARKVPVVYAVFTDANGQPRLRVAGVMEAAIAYAGGESIPADAGTINGLGAEMGYKPADPHAILLPKVDVNAAAPDIDEKALAAALAPAIAAALPDVVSDAELAKVVTAATSKIIAAIPTTFTATKP